MKFRAKQRSSDSPFIESIWHVECAESGHFTSVAVSYSEIVIARQKGQTIVTVRGPETKATSAQIEANTEYLGIVFKLGTFMPMFLPQTLKDRKEHNLPSVNQQGFWLDNSIWEIPTFENADTFIERLIRLGYLCYDALVGDILEGENANFSPRTLQYRFKRATGITRKLFEQIERAQESFALLETGTSIADTAYEMGYFDQAHLTNALKRFLGHTPSQIDHINRID